MREILDRIEQLLSLQEKLVNLMLLSGHQKIRLSMDTALDLLYYNIELLDLMEEFISSQEDILEDYAKEYTYSLLLESLSWMSLILPAIEDSTPIFLQGIAKEDPIYRVRSILSMVEEYKNRNDYQSFLRIAEELHKLSAFLKYQLLIAKRSYIDFI